MPDVLVYADTKRSPELRHELPIAVVDPFLHGEHDGRRFVLAYALEGPRLRALPELLTNVPYELTP